VIFHVLRGGSLPLAGPLHIKRLVRRRSTALKQTKPERKNLHELVLRIVKTVSFCTRIICGPLQITVSLSREQPRNAPDTAPHSLLKDGNRPRAIGEMVSHYRIVTRLATGGMSSVYRAVDTKLERPVALKFLRSPLTLNPDAVARFHFEARAASALNHPHVCTVYDVGEHEGQPFLVMELLEGQTLQELVKTCRPLPLSQVLTISAQILDALNAAHSKGIVHRDVKPANIFISSFGQAKLLDFGLAMNDSLRNPSTTDPMEPLEVARTMPGSIIGTAAYMSPEQARGWPLDSRTDLFSFGVVLYEMTTGRPPFGSPGVSKLLDQIVKEEPVRPTCFNPALPVVLEKVILKALKKDRSLRYQTAAELMKDLNEVKH
jgi:serine/threonine protein kinase